MQLSLAPQDSIASLAPPNIELPHDSIAPDLPAAMPLLPTVSLPDPNSIGVPPPANLPFPGVFKLWTPALKPPVTPLQQNSHPSLYIVHL